MKINMEQKVQDQVISPPNDEMLDGLQFVNVFKDHEQYSKYTKNPKQNQPVVIAFVDDFTTLQEIIDRSIIQFKTQFNQELTVTGDKYFLLELRVGYKITQQTIHQLKKRLNNSNINGLILIMNQRSKIQEPVYFTDQSYFNVIFQSQPKFNEKKNYSLSFNFLNFKDQTILLPQLEPTLTPSELRKKISETIYKIYKVSVSEANIDLKISPAAQKKMKLKQIYSNNSTNQIEILDKTVKLCSNNVSSEYIVIPIGGNQYRLNYQTVKDVTVQNLLILLKIQAEQKKGAFIDQKLNNLSLQFSPEVILGPHQTIKEAQQFIKSNKQAVNITAQIVREKHIFYKYFEKMKPVQYHELINKQDLTKNMTPQYIKERKEEEKKCRNRAEVRAKSQMYNLTRIQDIHPITVYTSENLFVDNPQSPHNPIPLYRAVNNFLRNQSVSRKKMTDLIKSWENQYAVTLISKLEYLEAYEGDVFRGVNFNVSYKKGDILQFKSFISTSKKIDKALHFAQDKTLYKFKSITGRPIWNFSVFEDEQEVLFMPYTKFEVESVDLKSKPKVYTLRQIDTFSKLTFEECHLLWVDNNQGTRQNGEKVLASICTNQKILPLSLHWLESTADLQKWFKQNGKYQKDQNIRIMIISNMKRQETITKDKKQVKVVVDEAGYETLKIARSFRAKLPVLYFVSYMPYTTDILKKYKTDMSNIKVVVSNEDLKEFILQNCEITHGNQTSKVMSVS